MFIYSIYEKVASAQLVTCTHIALNGTYQSNKSATISQIVHATLLGCDFVESIG